MIPRCRLNASWDASPRAPGVKHGPGPGPTSFSSGFGCAKQDGQASKQASKQAGRQVRRKIHTKPVIVSPPPFP
ncbi:hypothetical protein WAI453_005037 [Rhynchosporium graminicola]